MASARVRTKRDISFAIVVSEQTIRLLDALLSGFTSGPVRYEAQCADKVTRQFLLEELVSYPNAARKRITRLVIYSEDPQRRGSSAWVELSTQGASFCIDGPETLALPLAESIDDLFEGNKAWHSFLLQLDVVDMLLRLLSRKDGV